ncbi:PTR2-domain-containing protein [Pseudohyphozyma bogoriensis]|nr:PTR2-domain-containing protein [Pseudohyphozyma bogoriensis]
MTSTIDPAYAGLAEAAKHESEAHNDRKSLDIDNPMGLTHKTGVEITERTIGGAAAADGEFPSEHDRATLRRMPGPIRIEAYLIGLIELCERFSYYGTTAVFTNFIQQKRPPGSRTGANHGSSDYRSGALGKGQQASTGLTTFNQFWIYVTPLIGGYFADTYLGRYKMIMYAIFIAQIGHVLLTVSAIPSVIDHPNGAIACFSVALVIMGMGTGGFKSSISPMVAEQAGIGKLKVKTLKSGERVLLDPALTTSRVFMYFYLLINVGALAGQLGMVYAEQNVGFWLSYLLPTIVFFIAPVILFFGRNRYNRTPPQGSVLGKALKFIGFATKGRWTSPKKLFAADLWENAKPSRIEAEGRTKPAWMDFNDQYVDEIRRALKACQIFIFYPVYWLSYNQINNNLTSQAATMNTHGLPNDVLNNLDPFALLIMIPIFDLGLYPMFRKFGINFTPIKKITFGLLTASLSMVAAAVTQHYIYKRSPCGYDAGTCDEFADLNVWIQTPTYILIAAAEIFCSITGLEYAYTKAPKNMRSVVMGLFLLTNSVSSAIGEAFNPLSTDPLLVWNYGVFSAFSGVAAVLFWFTFRGLDAEERTLNEIGMEADTVEEDDTPRTSTANEKA